MGEKGTPFTRVLASSLIHAAKGKRRELVQGLTTAHTLNAGGEGHRPLTPIEPDIRSLIEQELKKVNPVAKKLFEKGGFVDFTTNEASAHMQSLAERTDEIVSGIERFIHPEERARRTVKEIIAKIMEKNNW